MKKVLLTRFGGIGDVAPVLVVAKALKRKGFEVHIALRWDEQAIKQTSLLENTDYCSKSFDMVEKGPWRNRCIQTELGWVSIQSIYDDYDEVIDFMHVVEYNSTCVTSEAKKPKDSWKLHRNSNWQNWTDLHLAWANIDPTNFPDIDKRAEFYLGVEEDEEVRRLREKYKKIISINLAASSLARTWYQASELPPKIIENEPETAVFLWNENKHVWEVFESSGVSEYQSPIKDPIRASMSVVGASDAYVGADTGFTHIAEGLGIKHVAIYSSVPSWTRNKYYVNQVAIDKGTENPEFYTFSLTLGDPLRVEEAMDSLTAREKKILDLYEKGVDNSNSC